MKIALGILLSKPQAQFVSDLDLLQFRLENKGFEVRKIKTVNCSVLHAARNMVVKGAQNWGADYLMFIDDDMRFNTHIVEDLLAHKKDIVCAAMFTKSHPFMPTMKKICNREKVWDLANYLDYPKDELFEIGACGMAATLIDMRVFDDTRLEKDSWFAMDEGFEELKFSEDMGFCLRARQKGYKIYCDSNVKTRHIGGDGIGEENWLYWKDKQGQKLL